jgi:hypothetical protein
MPSQAAPTSTIARTVSTGTIAGRMLSTGGPALVGGGEPPDSPIVGKITITRASGNVVVGRVETDRNGRFRLAVPAGEYKVTGTSPTFSGTLETGVVVRPGATATASLTFMAT